MGSSESHFNVSLIVRGSHKERPQTTTFEERAEAEFFWGPSAYQPNASLLGQAGWLYGNITEKV